MNRSSEALQIARKYTLYATAVGMVPVLVFDLAAVAAMQIKMISEIAKVYDVPFSSTRARVLVTGILGGLTAFSHGVPGWVVVRYGFLGVVGTVLKPFYASIVTYGIANVFVLHFERGGTLDDFNPAGPEVQQAVRDAYEKGRDVVTGRRAAVATT